MKRILILAAAVLLCGTACLEHKETKETMETKEEMKMNVNEKMILIDVRTPGEFAGGHLKGAVNIPYDVITEEIAAVAPDKNAKIYLYCRTGRRVGIAMDALKKIGYTNMVNLASVQNASETLSIEVVK